MFNVGIGEVAVIVLVCLVVFGPERLPEVARQAGGFLGQARLWTQEALDQLKQEADLKDLDLPDLRVGSLRRPGPRVRAGGVGRRGAGGRAAARA